MNDELLVARMNEIESILLALRRELNESVKKNTDYKPHQRYYTLKEAVELKFGKDCPYTTISTNYALMPCGNTNFEIIAGKKRWKSELILEWIETSDKDIPQYLAKYNVPLKGRIGEKYLKKYKKEEVLCPCP